MSSLPIRARALSDLRAGVAAVGAIAVLAACGANSTETPSASAPATSATAPESSVISTRPNKTLQDYIAENGITETQVRPGEPGVPVIKMPEPPPGWADAEGQTPDFAIGALVYTQPADPKDPPTIMVILGKLTGDVDPVKVLEFAPGELQNLPDYQSLGDPARVTLDGREAVQLSGTYNRNGARRVIAQKTVAIPATDALYVLQINAEGRQDEQPTLQAATAAIDQFTTIVS